MTLCGSRFRAKRTIRRSADVCRVCAKSIGSSRSAIQIAANMGSLNKRTIGEVLQAKAQNSRGNGRRPASRERRVGYSDEGILINNVRCFVSELSHSQKHGT